MNKLNRVMLMLIAMAAIMLLAVGIDKGLQRHERKMWEIEREAVYEEARADIASMQANIQTLSEDPEALISYIEENELNYTEKKEVFLEEPDRAEGDGSVSDNEAYKGEAENLLYPGIPYQGIPYPEVWNGGAFCRAVLYPAICFFPEKRGRSVLPTKIP